MTLNSYKPSGGNKCRLFTIRFVYFYLPIARSEIHGRKELGTLQTVRAYRQYEAEDKRLFRDAIQLAIIDAKTPTTVFFLTSTTGDDQGLSEGWTIPSSSIF
ncbi:hypothetical protein TNCV_321641 [Trichonephila clavipes]|nr:hypothetical protein TNCV_321641 [Trichonephila clavipes]